MVLFAGVFWGRRLLFSCSRRHSGSCSGPCPSPFCRLKHSVQAMLSSFLAFAEFGTGEGLLRYGICAPCKKQAFPVRKGYSVPKTPSYGTGCIPSFHKSAAPEVAPPRLSEKSASQSAIGLLGHSGRGRTNRRGTFRTGSPTGTKKEAPTECYFNRDFRKAAAAYSPTWWGSTIGASELNFSVRYGKRWILTAITAAVCYLREISRLKSWLTQKISGY